MSTACGKAHAAFDGRCIPPESPRFAGLSVALRSKYTRASSPGGGSSLARLVSRNPHRENWASPVSALTSVSPQAVKPAALDIRRQSGACPPAGGGGGVWVGCRSGADCPAASGATPRRAAAGHAGPSGRPRGVFPRDLGGSGLRPHRVPVGSAAPLRSDRGRRLLLRGADDPDLSRSAPAEHATGTTNRRRSRFCHRGNCGNRDFHGWGREHSPAYHRPPSSPMRQPTRSCCATSRVRTFCASRRSVPKRTRTLG